MMALDRYGQPGSSRQVLDIFIALKTCAEKFEVRPAVALQRGRADVAGHVQPGRVYGR
jgi:hypothetical protein